MPIHEVHPSEDYSEGNPYVATVCEDADEGFFHGVVRVEPPFTPGEDLIDYLKENVGVHLVHMLSSKEATLLGFRIDEETGFETWSNKTRVIGGVQGILDQLGRAANKELFTREYIETRERLHGR